MQCMGSETYLPIHVHWQSRRKKTNRVVHSGHDSNYKGRTYNIIELNDAVYWLWLSVHAVLLHAYMPDQVGEITTVRISSVE